MIFATKHVVHISTRKKVKYYTNPKDTPLCRRKLFCPFFSLRVRAT